MIQDIKPNRLYNSYDTCEPDLESYIIFVQGTSILCKIVDGWLYIPQYSECNLDDHRYLIRIDNHYFFSSWDATAIGMLERAGYEFHNIKDLRETQPKWLRFGAMTGFSIASWYEKNRYCGRCGAAMEHSEIERAVKCPECGNLVYPKICPVVIVGVIRGDKLLLAKYKDRMNLNRYALIAGFAEIGETIEQTVAREVFEETGVRVKNLKFYKSQPWAFSDSLLFGFYCEEDGDENAKPDGTELGFASFMDREDVPALQDEVSLTAEMMDRFKRLGREVLK